MVRGMVIRNDIIICPVCLKNRRIKRVSRPMDLNQHLAKKHPEFKYKVAPMKKLNANFSWIVRTKLK